MPALVHSRVSAVGEVGTSSMDSVFYVGIDVLQLLHLLPTLTDITRIVDGATLTLFPHPMRRPLGYQPLRVTPAWTH